MEIKRKNLCAMIPEEVHTRVCEEQEQMGLKLNEYVEMITKEHFEKGEKITANGTGTLAFQVLEELLTRIEKHLKFTGQSQKEPVVGLIEQALARKADQAEPVGNEQPDEAGTENE